MELEDICGQLEDLKTIDIEKLNFILNELKISCLTSDTLLFIEINKRNSENLIDKNLKIEVSNIRKSNYLDMNFKSPNFGEIKNIKDDLNNKVKNLKENNN